MRMKILLIILVFSKTLFADASQDSLREKLFIQKDQSKIAEIYNHLSFSFKYKNLDSCNYYADKAIILSELLKDTSQLSDAFYYKAYCANRESQFDSALILSKISLRYCDSIREEKRYLRNKLLFIESLTEVDNLKEAYRQLISLDNINSKEDADLVDIADAYFYLFFKKKQYDLALEKLDQVLPLVEKLHDVQQKINFYTDYSSIFGVKGDEEKAIKYLDLAYKLSESLDNEYFKIKIESNLSEHYKAIGDFQRALSFLEEPLRYYKKENIEKYYQTQCRKADLFIHIDKLKNAYKCLKIVEDNQSKIKADLTKAWFFYVMENYYFAKKDFLNAYRFQKRFNEFDDSLFYVSSTKEIDQLRIKYETEKKEKEILLLKKEKETDKILKQRIIYSWVATILLLVILIIIFILFRKNVKHRRALTKAKNDHLVKENQLKEQEKIKLEQEKNLIEIEKTKIEQESFILLQENKLLETQKEVANQKLQSHKAILNSTNNSLLQQSQLTSILIDALKSLKPYTNKEGQRKINSNLADLSNFSKEKNWQTFEQNFILLYPNFLNSLKEKQPSLTNSERKLCAFLKMGLNTSEITTITLQKPGTIRQLKYNIRKKLNIDSDEEISKILEEIV